MRRKETALLIEEWKNFNKEEELIYNAKLLLEKNEDEHILKESFLGKMTDWVQSGFDIAGFIPVLGEGFDGLNAIISLSRGRPFEALCSIISLFPGIGDVIGKGGKYLVKYLGPELDDIIQGKISKPSDLSENSILKKDLLLLEANKSDGKMFKLVVNAISKTKSRWFPFIKDFLESLDKDTDSIELVDKISKSGIKIPKVPDNLKEKIGSKIKDMIKDPKIILKKITTIVDFIDACAKDDVKK